MGTWIFGTATLLVKKGNPLKIRLSSPPDRVAGGGITASRPAFEPYVKVVPSYGSSLSKALFSTRLRYRELLVVELSVAVRVKDEQVGELICSPVDSLEHVMDVPSRFFRNPLVADRAFSFLFLP